jgi:hypothetical protein
LSQTPPSASKYTNCIRRIQPTRAILRNPAATFERNKPEHRRQPPLALRRWELFANRDLSEMALYDPERDAGQQPADSNPAMLADMKSRLAAGWSKFKDRPDLQELRARRKETVPAPSLEELEKKYYRN